MAIQGGLITQNEGRANHNRPSHKGGDKFILMPGATTSNAK